MRTRGWCSGVHVGPFNAENVGSSTFDHKVEAGACLIYENEQEIFVMHRDAEVHVFAVTMARQS